MEKNYDLIFTGGYLSLPNGNKKADLAIKDGKISAIGNINFSHAKKNIDISGLNLLPGVIDSQVHFREPGLEHKETLSTGTKAALLGGVTSIFEMPNTSPSTTNESALNDKLLRAKDNSWTNYAFFIGATPDNASSLNELEKLTSCVGVKIFMGSSTGKLLVPDDESLSKALYSCNRRVAIHSEDQERLEERFEQFKNTKNVSDHPNWRDKETAIISTKRILEIAKKNNAQLHILHISTAEEMALLKDKKNIATVEVTPQHLTLYSPDCYNRLGTLAQMNPPIRELYHQKGLWKGITDRTVDVIGSDHAPHTLEEKENVWPNSPSGMPGVQTLLPIMLNHVNNKKLSLDHLVELISSNPARIYNAKNKGNIIEGYDADLTLVDMDKSFVIKNEDIVSKCQWTPYDNMNVKGCPIMTIINGEIKMRDGKILGSPNGKAIFFDN